MGTAPAPARGRAGIVAARHAAGDGRASSARFADVPQTSQLKSLLEVLDDGAFLPDTSSISRSGRPSIRRRVRERRSLRPCRRLRGSRASVASRSQMPAALAWRRRVGTPAVRRIVVLRALADGRSFTHARSQRLPGACAAASTRSSAGLLRDGLRHDRARQPRGKASAIPEPLRVVSLTVAGHELADVASAGRAQPGSAAQPPCLPRLATKQVGGPLRRCTARTARSPRARAARSAE